MVALALEVLVEQTPVEFAYAVVDGPPANAHLQRRGNPEDLGPEVPRKNIDLLGGQPVTGAASGRLQLAEWIAAPDNPLAARVMVNRIWQHHFGRGLVATPSDFGRQGERPTHPELLDWLAKQFIECGWSMKSMHRLIMLSSTYQLAAEEDSPRQRLYGAFARRRLSAEEIRDSLLFVGGNLDLTPGGAHPFPPPEQWNYTQHDPFRADYQHHQRSVYLMRQRIQMRPLMAIFDWADANSSTDRRLTSTVPTQALYFLNNELLHQQAAALAARLHGEAAEDAEGVKLAHRIALGREADEHDVRDALTFLDAYTQQADRPRAWEAWCRVMLGSSEFIYLD